MGGSNPGGGGGGGGDCGRGCKMNDNGDCEVCTMWREISSFNRKSDAPKLVVTSDGLRDSTASDSSRDSSCIPQEVGAVPPRAPCDLHVLNEHVQPSNDIVYTTLPGCCVTKAQDEKVLEIAHTKKPEIPLHVANMNKRHVNLKDSCVYIPLQLVLNHFKDKITKATIQLEGPDNGIYSVGASKHSDDQVVLDSGWDTFVASQRIQEKDLLIFRSTENSRLEVVILDPSGHAKTSCFVRENSSSTQEMSDDSLQIVDPPPATLIDLSSSDDDDDMVGKVASTSVLPRQLRGRPAKAQTTASTSASPRQLRGRPAKAQKPASTPALARQLRGRPAKAQKMVSTSSPSTKSGPGARKPHDRASVKLEVHSEPLSNNVVGPSQSPYVLALGKALPQRVKRKIEKKVQAIRSKIPIFVKVMTMTCVDAVRIKCRMDFCTEYARAYLPKKRRALLLELEGKQTQWEATMDVRTDGCKFIYKGWREFVGQNSLEVGDICLFQLVSRTSTSLTMTVYLLRKSEIYSRT